LEQGVGESNNLCFINFELKLKTIRVKLIKIGQSQVVLESNLLSANWSKNRILLFSSGIYSQTIVNTEKLNS